MMEITKDAFHTALINDVRVSYGNIPNGLIEGFNGVTYYFKTWGAFDSTKHEKSVKPLIDSLISQNDTEYTSWVLQKCEALVWTPVTQVTVVSFRIRDSY